jgi:hypothetical protein
MTEDVPTAPRRVRRPALLGIGPWWVALLLLLAGGVLIGQGDTGDELPLANPDPGRVDEVLATFDRLPGQPLVLVAMDADLGSYPEIRPTSRAVLDDLLQRGASLAFISVTSEGRAIAVAEIDRLAISGAAQGRLLDLGFVSGVEAGLVRLVGDVLPSAAGGPMADAIAAGGGGVSAFHLVVLVGGVDVGPRTWVEQVGTRLPRLPMIAVAPTFAQPELAPYLRTGQLAALLATVRDGAAYAQAAAADDPAPLPGAPRADRLPSSLAMLLGMVAALLVLGRQLAGSLPGLAVRASREAAEEEQA